MSLLTLHLATARLEAAVHIMTYFKPNPYFLNYVLPLNWEQYTAVGRI